MTFELYTDNEGKIRWRLKAANGKVIADSGEGYETERAAMTMINLIKTDARYASYENITKGQKPLADF